MSEVGTPIERMTKEQRVVIVIGSGGVGKTTSAIALATLGAMSGKRVALLSIDPAKRLAAALGIPLGHELKPIAFPDSAGITGSVHAAMLDQKTVFDTMVRKHAPSPHIADRIMRDPLYIAASTNLSGPLEYMALARLQELADNPEWDLVVLDTPPDTHALDFLARPNVLAGFLDNKVIGRLLKPVVVAGRMGLGGVAALSEKVLGGVSSVTGFSALRSFGEFILLMQEVIEGFHASGERVLEILKRPGSSFVLVTVPTRAATRSAGHLAEQLVGMGYQLDGVVYNRGLPAAVVEAAASRSEDQSTVLQTRIKGEKSVRLELAHRLGGLQRSHQHWTVCLDEIETDLLSASGILAFAAEFRDPSRFMA